ncbi:MAG: Arc family DNA-binding protein [Pseudomonadota bacterium]|nr:Arc family DNA-binding protein [Pseudomonadota bacterium]
MPATITLKNIPDDLYQRLKEAADAHHRSINSEVIVCLERLLMPARLTAEERLARARRLRSGLKQDQFEADEIAEIIGQGRP